MKEKGAIGDHHSVRPPLTLPSTVYAVLAPPPFVDVVPTSTKVSKNKKSKLRKKARAKILQDLDPDPLLVIPSDAETWPSDAETGPLDAEMD